MFYAKQNFNSSQRKKQPNNLLTSRKKRNIVALNRGLLCVTLHILQVDTNSDLHNSLDGKGNLIKKEYKVVSSYTISQARKDEGCKLRPGNDPQAINQGQI